MHNPYIHRRMLPHDSDMFFGRTRELRSIEGSLLNVHQAQCVSITGERRIGKSSLAFRAHHRVIDSGNAVSVYVDCDELSESCSSKDEFFKMLSKNFSSLLESKPELNNRLESSPFSLFENYSSFKSFIKKESQRGFRFFIFLDEFEHLPGNPFADNSFFSNLRAMANSAEHNLAFVTVSQKSLKELTHQSIQSSGFWNIFKTEPVGLLDENSLDALRRFGFERNGLSLDSNDIETIEYYAGGFPFFNQAVCACLFDAKISHAEPDKNRLEVEIFPYYEKLWEDRTKKEQKLLKSLSPLKTQKHFAFKELQTRGLLKFVNGFYYPFSEFFSHLIKNRFRIERKKPTWDDFFNGLKKIKEVLGTAHSIKKDAKDLLSDTDKP